MDDDKQTMLIFGSIAVFGILAILYISAPMIFGTDVEKEITIIFNDDGGVLDSCGNFYYSVDTNAITRAKINMVMPENDVNAKPVTVKVIIREPLKGLPLVSDAPVNRPYIKDVPGIFPTPGECNGN